ncbi:MAG: hypothetical protein HY731_07895 [Candidatus Tectomicrobia bacterium]|nr:hypothetical protein [Candidatus Tectomicrobia bacterium]
MSRIKFLSLFFFMLSIAFSAQPALAFTVSPQAILDPTTQQFYLQLYLQDCDYDTIKKGNLTQYITITGVDQYAASQRYRYDRTIEVRGPFKASTTYQIKVDGKICNRSGAYSGRVSIGKYPPAIQFISKGLYFSKINPHLRFRHREISSIQWKIYRIGKENRYLFSRTEEIKLRMMQTTGDLDTTVEDADYYYQYLGHLEDYPGKAFEASSTVERTDDWKVDSLDLTPYYKEGDWLAIIVGRKGANNNEMIHLANKVIQFTNLGVYVRKNDDGLWGQTVALDRGDPVFAKVLLKQKNGEVLYETDTDIDGRFHLKWNDLASRSIQKDLQRIETVRGEDSIEIFLPEGPIPLGSFPISGADHKIPVQAFVYSDRGLYRLGDTVHLTTLIRNWDLTVSQIDMTSELAIEGPVGRVHRLILNHSEFHNGGATWSWSIPDNAKTGRYRAEMRNGGRLIGVGTFAIEQIIPPTIEGDVQLKEPYATWDVEESQISPVTGTVTSRFLFGAPASGKKWEYHCVIEAGKLTPETYKDFVFEDALKVFPAMTFFQKQNLTLDHDGKGTLECEESAPLSSEMVLEKLPGIGNIKVVANVFEEGGRSIQISQSIPGYFHEVYPGIRPMFEGNLDYGRPASFQIVALDPQAGQPKAGVKLKVELFEKDYRGWYYFHGWNEPVVDSELTRTPRLVEEIVSQDEPVSYSVTPPGCCDWELRVSLADADVSSRVAFRNGWWRPAAPASALSPKITLLMDKESYTVGETAKVLVDAPFDGELLLFHEKDGRPIVVERITVVDRKAEHQLNLTRDHSPWFHLNAILLRTVKLTDSGFQAKRETPYRALGMIPIQVHARNEFLTFAVHAPEKVMPHSVLPLTITALDEEGRKIPGEVWMTVAVVDEGILNLAKFSTPDPYTGLHQRPAYPNAWYDTFGQVIPYSLHRGESAFGGDQGPLVSARIQRVIPMAWWSGIIKTDPNGEITLNVPVDDYTGRVRVMVVGWHDKRTGSAEAKVSVFAPVDLLTSLPRVFGTFDQSQAVAEVFNNTEKEQNIEVSLSTEGPLKLSDAQVTATITIPAKQSKVVNWKLEGVGSPGKAKVAFFAKNQEGNTRARSTELFVRPLGIPLEFVESFLMKGGESYQVKIPDGLEFAPGTGEWDVTLSTSPAIKIAKHLKYLVAYPHGCIEQTTSRLFAMLMLKPTLGDEVLAQSLGTKKAGEIEMFIDEGIKKLGRMQMPDGGFAFWPGAAYQYSWLNAYVAHFLWKARQLNYQIPDLLYNGTLKRLKEQFAGVRSEYVSAQDYSRDVMAYSAFVLALNGQISRSDLQWLASELKKEANRKENVKLAVANSLARATMIRAGQPGVVQALLSDLPEVTLDSPLEWWRFSHYFLSREAAFASKLYTQALFGDKSVAPPALILLDKLAEQQYTSTHTIAWTLLAVDQIFSSSGRTTKATVETPQGTTHEITTEIGHNQVIGKLVSGNGQRFSIKNESQEGNLFGHFAYRGWPMRPPQKGFENQIELRRVYMNEQGRLLRPPFSVKQGERIFVVLMARHLQRDVESLSNVAVEDWLPAGFEIENPRLLGEDALPKFPREFVDIDFWKTDYVDYLDDKISIFGTLHREPRLFVFSVRAVSQGTFQLMPSTAEAMYIPEFRALAVEDGQVTVTP